MENSRPKKSDGTDSLPIDEFEKRARNVASGPLRMSDDDYDLMEHDPRFYMCFASVAFLKGARWAKEHLSQYPNLLEPQRQYKDGPDN